MVARRGYERIGAAANQSVQLGAAEILLGQPGVGNSLAPEPGSPLALPDPRPTAGRAPAVVPGKVLSTEHAAPRVTTQRDEAAYADWHDSPIDLQVSQHFPSGNAPVETKPIDGMAHQTPGEAPEPAAEKAKGKFDPNKGKAAMVNHVVGGLINGVKSADWTGRNMSKAQFYAHLHVHG